MIKKIIGTILAASMAAGLVFIPAYADEVEVVDQEETAAVTAVEEETPEISDTTEYSEMDYPSIETETQQTETAGSEDENGNAATDENGIESEGETESEPAAAEEETESDPEESEEIDYIEYGVSEEEINEEEEMTADLYTDSDTLLNNYLWNAGYETVSEAALFSSDYNGNKLTAFAKRLYSSLKYVVTRVASGEITDTKASAKYSADELSECQWDTSKMDVSEIHAAADTAGSVFAYDENSNKVYYSAEVKAIVAEGIESLIQKDVPSAVKTVIRDCPYEMYWFSNVYNIAKAYTLKVKTDSETGAEIIYLSSMTITVSLKVSDNYGSDTPYKTDQDKIKSVQYTIENAEAIVTAAAGLSDYDKLDYYRQQICDLTSYNYSASGTGYGDPWQLIYVFDGDPDTNVVCEGYAKAFQYLCERTAFDSDDLYVYSVSGLFSIGNASGGGHLWNIVRMDGKNYLVDITNCDGTSPSRKLFMVNPVSGSVDDGYIFASGYSRYKYVYYSDTRNMYSDAELSIDLHVQDAGTVTAWDAEGLIPTAITYTCTDCGFMWTESTSGHKLVIDNEILSKCTEDGLTEGWHCSECGQVFVRQEIVPAPGHSFISETTKEATCTQTGERINTCTVCGYIYKEEIPALGHQTIVVKQGMEATLFTTGLTDELKCTVCNETVQVQTVIPMQQLTRTLSKGMSGDDVKQVQTKLSELGYLSAVPDGIYGAMTQAAVSEFQIANGLGYSDGKVGSWTLNKLRNNPVEKTDKIILTRTLKKGMYGADVLAVQKKLSELGYLTASPDGSFGAKTEAAVREFQIANGLGYSDGMVGNWTVSKLNGNPVPKSDDTSKIVLTRVLSKGMSGADVLAVQKRLYELGYLTAEPDGKFGAKTEAAVRAFQIANGLGYSDGMVGNWTVSKLNGNPVSK